MVQIDSHTMQLDGQRLFTCLSCTIAFLTAEEQRTSVYIYFLHLLNDVCVQQESIIARTTTDTT
jgi:hypothetical protein